jgi:hypothetical protein
MFMSRAYFCIINRHSIFLFLLYYPSSSYCVHNNSYLRSSNNNNSPEIYSFLSYKYFLAPFCADRATSTTYFSHISFHAMFILFIIIMGKNLLLSDCIFACANRVPMIYTFIPIYFHITHVLYCLFQFSLFLYPPPIFFSSNILFVISVITATSTNGS